MARAAGKVSKKRGRRRRPSRAKKKQRRIGSRALVARAKRRGRVHTIMVAPSALTDPAEADKLRGGLAALDPALLPELAFLVLELIQRFKLYRGSTSWPSKETLIKFLAGVRMPDRSALSERMLEAIATVARPLAAQSSGRPRKHPRDASLAAVTSTDAQPATGEAAEATLPRG